MPTPPTPHPGFWEVLSYDAQVHAVHAMMLHTGKILYYDDEPPLNQTIQIESRLWDPSANPPVVTRNIPHGQLAVQTHSIFFAPGTTFYLTVKH